MSFSIPEFLNKYTELATTVANAAKRVGERMQSQDQIDYGMMADIEPRPEVRRLAVISKALPTIVKGIGDGKPADRTHTEADIKAMLLAFGAQAKVLRSNNEPEGADALERIVTEWGKIITSIMLPSKPCRLLDTLADKIANIKSHRLSGLTWCWVNALDSGGIPSNLANP